MDTVWKVLTRKKVIDPVTAEETQLARRLNTFDLTALGVGSTLGVGLYVIAGHVAKTVAGPSVVLSFLIAAVASAFAGLCYAEFGARAPRAGSAYIYSYVCVGEFVAFIIGWNLILEYIIGSASVAKGLSSYLDTLINNTFQNTFTEIAPINIPYMAKYFDFFACGVSILLAVALAFGLKESSLANNIFTSLNIGVVLFTVVAGSLKADTANWDISPDNSTNSTIIGKGGFFPFGLEGTITGAATCFYAFVGFDCIATTAEEVKNPKKAIPISIVLSLLIIFLAYFGVSTVVTLMVPYYLQDKNAPIPFAFEHVGWNWAKWVVSIGAIFGLCASLFGAMFPLPRIIYAMASDSLVFKFLGKVSSRFQTPVVGTLLAGTFTGLMAALFELEQLVNMMSIGTLMAYTIVAASVLLLRYSDTMTTFDMNNRSVNNDVLSSYEQTTGTIGQIFNCGRYTEPTKTSQSIVAVEVVLYCVTCVLLGLCAIFLQHPIVNGKIWAIVMVSVVILVAAILLMSMATQPVSRTELSFKVPMVPLIPALSILGNIYLMLMLDSHTWIRFAVWMTVGLPTYYFSLRPIDDKPIDTKHFRETIEYTDYKLKANGNLNYHTNNGFVDDNGKEIPPEPKIEDKTPVAVKIQLELEKLDEMLDEVAQKLDTNNRNASVGSVSVSDVSREENVVADVHCNDVLAPAIPLFPHIHLSKTEIVQAHPSLSYVSPPLEKNLFVINNITDDNNDQIDVEQNEIFLEDPIVVGEPLEPPRIQRPLSFVSHTYPEEETAEAVQFTISPITTPPSSASTTPLPSPKFPEVPPPPPLPVKSPVMMIKPEIRPFKSEKKDTRGSLPRITSSKIKEVTLRPTKRREEDSEEDYKPDDDNLKLGSDRAKSFIEQLSHKLTTPKVMPTYVLPKKKKAPAPPPPKIVKNEDVILENIDRRSAQEKMGEFVNSRINIIAATKKNDSEDTPKAEDAVKFEESEPNNLEEKNGFLDHQDRMKNVFRSMKNVEVSKEQAPTSRNVKSLDRRHDEAKHRQAMTDILQLIELRRKESFQQQSKV